jgi:hypothetical protein
VFVKFDDAFQVRADDVLLVCGTTGSLDQYLREFQAMPVTHSPRA